MTAAAGQGPFAVGEVVGFHGLRGEVKIVPATNSPDLLLEMKSVEIRLPDSRTLHAGVRSVRLSRRLLFIAFEEWRDRTAVEFLAGAQIFVSREQLAPLSEDEWWVSDLVGLEAYTTGGDIIGKVIAVVDGGNQMLEIQPAGNRQGKTILVPFVQHLVPKVDLQAGRIEVLDLPGLLEPQ